MEADLARFYGIDYRDRWRQPGSLTFRRLAVLLWNLPPEAIVPTLARDGEPHWSVEAHLLDDLRIVWTSSKDKPGTPHPARPSPQRTARRRADPVRARKLAAARRRAHDRRQHTTQVEEGA